MVHKSLDSSVAAVIRIADGGCKPHWPCRLLLRGDARHKAVRRLIRPDKIPGDLPVGFLPQSKMPWGHNKCDSSERRAKAFRDWYQKARDTWAHLLGRRPRTTMQNSGGNLPQEGLPVRMRERAQPLTYCGTLQCA